MSVSGSTADVSKATMGRCPGPAEVSDKSVGCAGSVEENIGQNCSLDEAPCVPFAECQSAFKFGSDAILVQLLFRADQSGLKQIDVPATIHLTSD